MLSLVSLSWEHTPFCAQKLSPNLGNVKQTLNTVTRSRYSQTGHVIGQMFRTTKNKRHKIPQIGAAIILLTTQIGLFRSGFTRSLPIAAAICLEQVLAGAFLYTTAELKSQMEQNIISTEYINIIRNVGLRMVMTSFKDG